MKTGRRIRARGFAFAALALLSVPLLLLGTYEKVHRWAAEQALALLEENDRGRTYAEVYAQANKERIIAGSWMEDYGGVEGNERSFVRINKFLSLDGTFNTMAQLSQGAVRNKFPLPIGVRLTSDTTDTGQTSLAASQANYSFFPAIDFNDPAEAERYFELARGLLKSSVRLNGGLLEFFHDLVNPPPYIRSVEVQQAGQLCYAAAWVDITDTVSVRVGGEPVPGRVVSGETAWTGGTRPSAATRNISASIPAPRMSSNSSARGSSVCGTGRTK